MSDQRPNFEPGKNIAIKVPAHEHAAVVRFYGDVLGFKRSDIKETSVGFDYGDKTLWVDRCPGLSRSEVWLEICADDPSAANAWLREAGLERCDSIEPLPEDFRGFWVMAPSNMVHLISCR